MIDKEGKLYKLKSEIDNERKINEIIDKAQKQTYLSGFDFAILIQNLLVSPTGWVMDTGTWENANREIALLLVERIRKHKLLWKLLFMVA